MLNNIINMFKKITILLIITGTVMPLYYIKYAERGFDIDALDPINAERTWRQLRFESTMHGRLWFKNDKMQNVADLAESLPDQSNSKEAIIKIRDNARWQDGEEITTEDIEFTFNLYRDCDIYEYSSVAKKLIVEQIDTKTFRLKPVDGTRAFWYYVMDGVSKLHILPKHIIGDIAIILPGDDFSKQPLGAGTFKIEKIKTQGSKITIDFIRHPYYYFDEYASSEKVKELTLVTEPIMTNILASFRIPNEDSYSNGKKKGLDLIVEEVSSIQNLEIMRTYQHVRSKTYEKNRWTGIAINTRKELLDNTEFRILLDQMIDARDIMRKAYDDGARPITGPFHPSFGIQNEGLLDRVETDMSIIKKKLEDDFNVKEIDNKLHVLDKNTGEYKPLKFRLIYKERFVEDGSRESDALFMIKDAFEFYGIEIEEEGLDSEVYKTKIKDFDYWDLAFDQKEFSWNNNIWPIFNPKNSTHTGNITGYNNPVLTDLFTKFFTTSNVKAKKELGEQIHQHCYDNVPYLFLWSSEPMCFYRNTIRDLTLTPMEFFSTIRTWGVENRD